MAHIVQVDTESLINCIKQHLKAIQNRAESEKEKQNYNSNEYLVFLGIQKQCELAIEECRLLDTKTRELQK